MAAYVDGSAWREEFDELFCGLEDNWELIEIDNLPPINEDQIAAKGKGRPVSNAGGVIAIGLH